MINNKVTVIGHIETRFILDHEYYHENYYQFLISIKRVSGTKDIIPVLVSDRIIDVTKDYIGKQVSIVGEFRSFNYHDNDKIRLLLYIFPIAIKLVDNEKDENAILLQGTLCKDPIHRETPQGRLITDLLLAVTRDNGKSDYIPCIAWGRNAYYLSTLSVGSIIRVAGRVQSRDYTKDGSVHTCYEISINLVETVS